MANFTKHCRPLVILVLLVTGIRPTYGAHIIGGEITYECTGYTNGDSLTNSRTYFFTMRIYRDCQGNGADFDGAPGGAFPCHVTIYRGTQVYQVLTLSNPAITNIDPNPGNPCLIVPRTVCVEEGVYTFPKLELPISDQSYYVIYQRCCRNNTISNIREPEGSGATYYIELTPEAQRLGNSSPSFTDYPPIVLCADEDFIYNFSAVDKDGDQLVYELCSPFLGGGRNFDNPDAPNGLAPNPERPPPYQGVNFLAPNYTAIYPLGQDSRLELSSNTGVMRGRPAFIGQFVVGICVSEYRNGRLLSTLRRDFQFNITYCDNAVTADIREDSIADDESFIVGLCGKREVTLYNESGQLAFIKDYRWEFYFGADTLVADSRDLTLQFPALGRYRGRLIVNPNSEVCSDTAAITVNVFPGMEVDLEYDYDTCRAGPVVFSSLVDTEAAQAIRDYHWSFGDIEQGSGRTTEHIYNQPGDYDVQLTVTDANGCKLSNEKSLVYKPVPSLIIVSPNALTSCVPASVFFDNLSSPVDDTYIFDWDFGDGQASDEISPTHSYQQSGTYDVSIRITSPIGCSTDTVFRRLIHIEESPVAGFNYSPEEPSNFAPQIDFSDQSRNAYRWYWDFNGLATSIRQHPTFTFPDTGLVYVKQVVTHPTGCQDSLIQWIDIKPEITLHFPNAFTPNDDSTNDIFLPVGVLRGTRQYACRIWNRWGALVFENSDPAIGWNGRVNGTQQAVPPGVYLYEVSIVGPRGEPISQRGFVTVIR